MLEKFLAEHEILRVATALPGYLCADLIVDDPVGLVHFITGTNCCICRINWWELASIAAGSTLGMGGPRDPRAPQERFFSEIVHLSRDFDPASNREDYLSYIANVKAKYPQSELFPSFDIIVK